MLLDSVEFCLTSPRVLAGLLATCAFSYCWCICASINGRLMDLCELFLTSSESSSRSAQMSSSAISASRSDNTVSCFVAQTAPNKSEINDDTEDTDEECQDDGNAQDEENPANAAEDPDMKEAAEDPDVKEAAEKQSDSLNAQRKRKSEPVAEFCPKRVRSVDEHEFDPEKRVEDSKVEHRGKDEPSAGCDPVEDALPPKREELSEGLAARLVELGACPEEPPKGCPEERNVNRSADANQNTSRKESGITPWNLFYFFGDNPDGSDVQTPETNHPRTTDEAPKLTRNKKTFSRLTDEGPRSSCMWSMTPGELRAPNYIEPEIITLSDEPQMPILDCSVADISIRESKLGLSQMDCDEMDLDLQLMLYRDIQSSHRLFADFKQDAESAGSGVENLHSSDAAQNLCPEGNAASGGENVAHLNLPQETSEEHVGETSAEEAYRPLRCRNYPGIAEQPLQVKKDARFQKRFYKKTWVVLPRKLGKAIRQAVSPESHPNELEEHRSRTLSEEEQKARLKRQTQMRRYIEQCLEDLNRSSSDSDSHPERRERSPSSSPQPDSESKQKDESVQTSANDREQSADSTFEAPKSSEGDRGPPITLLTPPPSPSNLPLKARKYWSQSIDSTSAKSKLTNTPEIIKISSAETRPPEMVPEQISPDSPEDKTMYAEAILAPFELHQAESASLEIVHVVDSETGLIVEAYSTGSSSDCYSTESGETANPEKMTDKGTSRVQDTSHLQGEFCTTEGENKKILTASDPSSQRDSSLNILQVEEDELEQILDHSDGGSVTEGENDDERCSN